MGENMNNVAFLAGTIIGIVSLWMIFVKANKPGWASLIPFYNTYVLFEITFGSGIKFLWLLVPLVNIYFLIKLCLNLARSFGKSTGFGIGIIFLSIIFLPILAFSDAEYIGPQA